MKSMNYMNIIVASAVLALSAHEFGAGHHVHLPPAGGMAVLATANTAVTVHSSTMSEVEYVEPVLRLHAVAAAANT